MPAFFATITQTAGMPAAKRAIALRRLVLEPYHQVYTPGETTDLTRYLTSIEPNVPAMQMLHDAMIKQLPEDEDRFRRQFPDFDTHAFSIYLIPSLNRFDGQVHDVGGDPGILFGIDDLASLKVAPSKLPVIVTHEFLHMYQGQRNIEFQSMLNADNPPVYATLWSEGMATYVSYALNPGVSLTDVLSDAALGKASRSTVGNAACQIKSHLDDASAKTAQAFFNFEGEHDEYGLPPRSGYLVGFTLVKTLSSHLSLQQLAMMHGKALHDIISETITKVCAEDENAPAAS